MTKTGKLFRRIRKAGTAIVPTFSNHCSIRLAWQLVSLVAVISVAPALAATKSERMEAVATVVPYPYHLITPDIQKRICSQSPKRVECSYILHELIPEGKDRKGVEFMAPKNLDLEIHPETRVVFQNY